MTKMLMAFVVLFAGSAFAERKVICVNQNIQDGTFAASFTLGSSGTKVELFVPTGETTGEMVSGECRRVAGAIEFSQICDVVTSSQVEYQVGLFSIGGAALHAMVSPRLSVAGSQPTFLDCKE